MANLGSIGTRRIPAASDLLPIDATAGAAWPPRVRSKTPAGTLLLTFAVGTPSLHSSIVHTCCRRNQRVTKSWLAGNLTPSHHIHTPHSRDEECRRREARLALPQRAQLHGACHGHVAARIHSCTRCTMRPRTIARSVSSITTPATIVLKRPHQTTGEESFRDVVVGPLRKVSLTKFP